MNVDASHLFRYICGTVLAVDGIGLLVKGNRHAALYILVASLFFSAGCSVVVKNPICLFNCIDQQAGKP